MEFGESREQEEVEELEEGDEKGEEDFRSCGGSFEVGTVYVGLGRGFLVVRGIRLRI